jgi:hypothetical protein
MEYTNLPKPTTPYSNEDKFSLQTGFLLNEDGTYLLQENGDRILLNYPGGYDRIFRAETIYTNINKPS